MTNLKEKAKTFWEIEKEQRELCDLDCETDDFCVPNEKVEAECNQKKWVSFDVLVEKATETYAYYYAKSERIHGCYALASMFGVNISDALDVVDGVEFGRRLREAKKA
jgi:hypothetical protein